MIHILRFKQRTKKSVALFLLPSFFFFPFFTPSSFLFLYVVFDISFQPFLKTTFPAFFFISASIPAAAAPQRPLSPPRRRSKLEGSNSESSRGGRGRRTNKPEAKRSEKEICVLPQLLLLLSRLSFLLGLPPHPLIWQEAIQRQNSVRGYLQPREGETERERE